MSITSQNTGSGGIYLANGSANDVLTALGFTDNTTTVRNAITGGAQSTAFSSSTQSIQSLLGLTNAASDTVEIDGQSILVNLASDSLGSIAKKINANTALQAAGVSASIVSSSSNGTPTYTLQIDGTQNFTDASNILQTLGVLKQGNSAVIGLTGGTGNTANGQAITGDTLLTDIDGYNTWTSGDEITIQGTDHNGNSIASSDFTITSTSTMSDLLSAIDNAYGGQVTASVNSSGAIVVEDNQSGTSKLAMTLTPTIGNGNSTLNFGTFTSSTLRERQITAGTDAEITLNGSDITSATNTINNAISGVTLNLLGADPNADITLNVSQNTSSIEQSISTLVSAYNTVMTDINTQQTYNSTSSTSSTTASSANQPPLFADATLESIKQILTGVIFSGVSGVSNSSLNNLCLIGINADETGMLSVDSTTLNGYLSTNFNDVKNLFIAQGSSTNSALTYVSSGQNTQGGTYEVNITQAAQQATTTGSGFNGTLGSDVTLNLTDTNGNTAQIALSQGMSINSIVNAINSELSQQYQQIIVGANSYYSDASQTNAITANTTWNSVYDSTGATANLQNGDTISFSGTNRNGNTVSGSYTISDTSTGTVGDLLNAIDSAFGSGYDAYIDSQGRIAIEDTTAGNSQLSLSVTPTDNLDFGSIGVNQNTGDGSQSGRYSMDITAINDSGQLEITSNAYGSSSGFTLNVTGDTGDSNGNGILGMTDGTYKGTDVAGQIRKTGSSTWETMTGNGQLLTGATGQDVDGLAIKYTGSTVPTGTLDFNFVNGVGQLFDQDLTAMTDPNTGYVATQQTSIQNQIGNINTHISDLEARIAMDQEAMTQEYVNMETMISQLDNQKTWLTDQIDSLNNNSSS
jgi:flagellar hook-associated protein 2